MTTVGAPALRELYFPPKSGRAWETVRPVDIGWNDDALSEVVRFCGENDTGQLMVLHQGRILVERHWGGAGPRTTQDVASVQKSFVFVLLGSLIERGAIELDDPVSKWLGRGWSRTDPVREDAVVVRHLMSMTSGLYDDFSYEAAPETTWYYNNNAYHQLRRIVRIAARGPLSDAFDRRVGTPIGLERSRWVDRRDSFDPNGFPIAGLQSGARDLARLGLLILAGGTWRGRELLGDGSLLAQALRPSQPINPSYGYLWWLPTQPCAIVPGGPITDPLKSFGGHHVGHRIIRSAPQGLVAAMGAGAQRLYVSNGLGVVAVRLGTSPSVARGGDFDEGFWHRMAEAVPR
jgi:CubicO group peptidase (beta-lactamase class C family)